MTPYRALLISFGVLVVVAGGILTAVATGAAGPGTGLSATLGLMAVAAIAAGAAGYWLLDRRRGREG